MKTNFAATTLTAAAVLATAASAQNCKPVDLIMTRASGSAATFENGTWSTAFGLSTVNTASVQGALKYIMTETIDFDTGYTNNTDDGCHRKNWVSYIHFYSMTVCNSDAALWWFNERPAGYGDDPEAYNYGEYGQYLTMDSGACHDSPFCDYLHGNNGKADLGPFVGWQNVSDDVRNPTSGAYWYSLPGECPQSEWPDKDDECTEQEPSGLCEEGVTPDGVTCTWSYNLLGQVSIDDLVGITSTTNPATGRGFIDAEEYCLAGNKEFVRDPETYDFVSGLPFWEGPLDLAQNAARIETLLTTYADGENNIALPTSAALTASNPRCYTSHPNCFADGAETCTRDQEQLCVPCEDVDGGCAAVTDAAAAFDTAALTEVSPGTGISSADSSDTTSGGTDDSSAANAVVATSSSILLGVIAMLVFLN